MKDTFGFIGTGNMGGAVAKAVCRSVGGQKLLLCNRSLNLAAPWVMPGRWCRNVPLSFWESSPRAWQHC